MVIRMSVSAKRLVIYFACAVAIYLIGANVVAPRLPNAQRDNMKRIDAHIALIRPQWEEFKRTNGGFDSVVFRPDTREDGLFAITGYVTSQVQVAQLLEFVSGTKPPRPLYTNALQVVTPERLEMDREAEVNRQ